MKNYPACKELKLKNMKTSFRQKGQNSIDLDHRSNHTTFGYRPLRKKKHVVNAHWQCVIEMLPNGHTNKGFNVKIRKISQYFGRKSPFLYYACSLCEIG